MARRKRTPPEVSTITRPATVAYARKTKPGGGPDDGEAGDAEAHDDADAKATTKIPAKHDVKDDAKDDAKKPDAAPERPTLPIDRAALAATDTTSPVRARVDTATMPEGGFGAPPEIPQPSGAGIVIKGGAVEDPTHMPGPRDIPPGSPDDVASPPGHVPPGDSRSLRRRGDQYEFALVYRIGNAVISRAGVVGTRGVWRVVEYPTMASASHAYAREASRFVTDGFSDYRD